MKSSRSVADLRNQHVSRQTEASGGGSASTTILEKIKGNQASRQDGEACVFQKLQLDTTVVRSLQSMKEFQQELSQLSLPSPTSGALRRPAPPKPQVVHKKGHTLHTGDGGRVDGPSIYIPVASERIRIQDMKEVLKDEYAARYCELIGVAPSQQNMSLVQKLMPFEKCRVSQSTQQNGIGRTERRNNVVIQPCYHAPRASGPNPDEVPFELLTLDLLHQRASGKTGTPAAALDDGSAPHDAGVGKLSFEQYKNEFVFPFNLKERFEGTHQQKKEFNTNSKLNCSGMVPPQSAVPPPSSLEPHAALPAEGTATKLAVQDALLHRLRDGTSGLTEEELRSFERRMKVPPCGDPQGDPSRVAEAAAVSSMTVSEQMIQRELATPWAPVDVQEVRLYLLQFVRDFPFDRFDGRLDDAALMEMKSLLISDDVASIAVEGLRFVFAAYVAPISPLHSSSVTASERDAYFLALCRRIVRFVQQRQKAPTAGPEDLPLCILCLRVVLRAVLSVKLPVLCSSATGVRLLHKIDALVLAVLDPFGLQSHISVLESTLQAQRVLRTKRLPPKLGVLSTTPLIQFIVGDGARSTEAKRMTRHQDNPDAQEGLDELRQHLTPSIRSELLRIVSTEKILRDVGR